MLNIFLASLFTSVMLISSVMLLLKSEGSSFLVEMSMATMY